MLLHFVALAAVIVVALIGSQTAFAETPTPILNQTGGNTVFSVPYLTQHALNTSLAVQNRQVIGLNVIISFD